MALPAFRLVRAAFPDAESRYSQTTRIPTMSRAWEWRQSWRGPGVVDNYLYYPVGLRNLAELFRLRSRIARERFDAIVYLSYARFRQTWKVIRDSLFFLGMRDQPAVRLSLCPARRARTCASLQTNLYQSESDRLVSNLRRLGQVDLRDDQWWDLHLRPRNRHKHVGISQGQSIDPVSSRLSIGTKDPANDWTQPNWLALVRRFDDRYSDRGLVTFGSADEYDRSASLLSIWSGPRAQSVWAPFTARVSAAILKKADCFLGLDSGPMHLAANVGTPCVVVFSARIHPGGVVSAWPRSSGDLP